MKTHLRSHLRRLFKKLLCRCHQPGRIVSIRRQTRTAWLLFPLVGFLTAKSLAQTNSAAPWVSLFNAKDLTGWTIKGNPSGQVRVAEGEMICHQAASL